MTTGNAIVFLAIVILVRWVGDWTITLWRQWSTERRWRKERERNEARIREQMARGGQVMEKAAAMGVGQASGGLNLGRGPDQPHSASGRDI